MFLILLAANLLPQSALAACQASAATPRGHPNRARHVLAAALRGILNLELAYQEFFKKRAADAADVKAMQRHTAAALYYRLAELVFEAPQVLISWTVLLLRLTADFTLRYSGEEEKPKSAWVRAFQAVSAGFGLVSLSIAAMEYMRLHPRSAWASSRPPTKLLFGLIDVGRSARQSAVMGMYAFCSLLNRSFLYMLIIQADLPQALSLRGGPERSIFFINLLVVPTFSFVFNAPLLLGLNSWFILPAAVISIFINIPWVTGKALQFRIGRWSSWPAWVMAFAYFSFTVVLIVFVGVPNPKNGARGLEDPSFGDSDVSAILVAIRTVASVICAAELCLFLGMAGWQSDRRRKYFKQHGSTEHMAEDLGIAIELPACLTSSVACMRCLMSSSSRAENWQ